MKEKIKNSCRRVKTHFRENKQIYISGGVGIALGALAVSLKDEATVQPTQKVTAFKTGDITQHMEVVVHALGDPGNVIQDVDTGTIYASQGQAARELGVNPSRISEHLSGKLDNVSGHRFEKIGKAKPSA